MALFLVMRCLSLFLCGWLVEEELQTITPDSCPETEPQNLEESPGNQM